MVIVKLTFKNFKNGKGLWKLNNSLLHDTIQYLIPLYNLNNINEIFLEIFKINDQLFLEILLTEIRGKTISYASYKKKKRNEREKQLMSEIQNLEKRETQVESEIIENKKTARKY